MNHVSHHGDLSGMQGFECAPQLTDKLEDISRRRVGYQVFSLRFLNGLQQSLLLVDFQIKHLNQLGNELVGGRPFGPKLQRRDVTLFVAQTNRKLTLPETMARAQIV